MVSIAGVGRTGMLTSSSTGIVLSAASEARASASPLSSTGGGAPPAPPPRPPPRPPAPPPPGPEQASDQPGVGGRDGPGSPRGGQQHRRSRRGGGERAGEGRDAERALAEQSEWREHRHRAQPGPRRVVAERPPPERVTQVDKTADPEEHGVQLDQADPQPGQQVGHDPPAGPIPKAPA